MFLKLNSTCQKSNKLSTECKPIKMFKESSSSMVKVPLSDQLSKINANNKVLIFINKGISLARLIPRLVSQAKNTIRDLDSHNDLKFMRLKTSKN